MELPQACSSEEALKTLRDDFDFAHAIMKHAVRKDIASFTLSGLRVPAVLQGWQSDSSVPQPETFAVEMTIFQDHLHDRVTMLAQNRRMLREIWAFNERTRPFREFEFNTVETAAEAIRQTAELVAALLSRVEDMVIAALDQSLAQRLRRIDILTPQAIAAQEQQRR